MARSPESTLRSCPWRYCIFCGEAEHGTAACRANEADTVPLSAPSAVYRVMDGELFLIDSGSPPHANLS